jgi:hypothetical protein
VRRESPSNGVDDSHFILYNHIHAKTTSELAGCIPKGWISFLGIASRSPSFASFINCQITSSEVIAMTIHPVFGQATFARSLINTNEEVLPTHATVKRSGIRRSSKLLVIISTTEKTKKAVESETWIST